MSLVEYHDPDGLFPLIHAQLLSRLPLRKLHWKSPSRPLRSIESLRVELVPSAQTVAAGKAPSSSQDGISTSSRNISQDAEDSSNCNSVQQATPEVEVEVHRRHQIPGLRQTPSLKIYILRCDDTDTYRSTSRRLLREWISANTSKSTKSSSQENHDAFEWLIVHVVLPETPAALQPRWSKSSEGEAHMTEKSSSSKWPGKSTNTILEKIKSDFNQSSKSEPDRVAQIRVRKQKDTSAAAAVVSPGSETLREWESSWGDLISKLKTLLLASFNLRVMQYEDDVRERDSQRALPGWNFCTFFVLKEGLARVFESVGLNEDALMTYDELAAGLETTIRTQLSADSLDLGRDFLPYTVELRDAVIAELSASADSTVAYWNSEQPLNISDKDYRTAIVSNNISIFDFQNYIFSRQLTLLLRLSKLRKPITHDIPNNTGELPADSRLAKATSDVEDITFLEEFQRRAATFVTLIARVLRADLRSGLNDLPDSSTPLITQTVETFISRWTFSLLHLILVESNSLSLPEPPPMNKSKSRRSSTRLDLKSLRRSSSGSSQNIPSLSRRTSSDRELRTTPQLPDGDSVLANPTLANIAAKRAEMLLSQRRLLNKEAAHFGWSVDRQLNAQHNDASTDGYASEEDVEPRSQNSVTHAPRYEPQDPLSASLATAQSFRYTYEDLSRRIQWYYRIAGRKGSAEQITVDLAVIKFKEGDFAAAANLLNPLAASQVDTKWALAETWLLQLYASCLKALNRKDEYIRTTLAILARSAAAGRDCREPVPSESTPKTDQYISTIEASHGIDPQQSYSDLVAFSEQLTYDVSTPLETYFGNVEVEPIMHLREGGDGFHIRFRVRQLIAKEITLHSARVRLLDARDGHSDEISLQSTGIIKLDRHTNEIWLSTNVATTGRYLIDKISLLAGRIAFTREALVKPDRPTTLGQSLTTAPELPLPLHGTYITCYPRSKGLTAEVTASRRVHLGKYRAIEVLVHTGDQEVSDVTISVRPASAGLRLKTSSAEKTRGGFTIAESPKQGTISILDIANQEELALAIPYDIERDANLISVRVEVQYRTKSGNFVYKAQSDIDLSLHLDVNVQDFFQQRALVSKFSINVAGPTPLVILSSHLDGSDAFEVQSALPHIQPLFVFAQKPVYLTYRIVPKHDRLDSNKKTRISTKPQLVIEYRTLLEDVTQQIVTRLATDIEDSTLQDLVHFAVGQLRAELHEQITSKDCERFVYSQKIILPTFRDISWTSAVAVIPEELRTAMLEWVGNWYTQNSTLPLPSPIEAESSNTSNARRLLIDIDIPKVRYLHSAAIQLLPGRPHPAGLRPPEIVTLGEPLAAKLHVRHTRLWDGASGDDDADQQTRFICDIYAPPDQWLLSGSRRKQFTAAPDMTVEFDISLVPLKTGSLLLPRVEIRLAPGADNVSGSQAQQTPASTVCETECETQTQVVTVVAGMRSTTVGVPAGGRIGEGPVLLAAELGGRTRRA